jgi:hypothetical protein
MAVRKDELADAKHGNVDARHNTDRICALGTVLLGGWFVDERPCRELTQSGAWLGHPIQ